MDADAECETVGVATLPPTERSDVSQAAAAPTVKRRGAPVALVPRAHDLDVVESKLRPPGARPGEVSRTALVNRLRVERAAPVVLLVAPAGYGKTTVLAQWAARDERPFAWLSLDERDNDPLVLLRHLAATLGRVAAVDASTLDALGHPGGSVWTRAVPRLARTVARLEQPVVLVLDGLQCLRAGEAADVLALVLDQLPAGSQAALAGRVEPALPVARLRAAGRLLELGPEQLALTRRETELLLRGAGRTANPLEVADVAARTEGWAAGLALVALAGRHQPLAVDGHDRFLADYFHAECLAGLPAGRLDFLRRTSPLETLSGPLCDHVLGCGGSAHELAALEADGLFVVRVDRSGSTYRYHRLLRGLLRHELEEQEPERAHVLHRRAADWYEAHGDPESALRHAAAVGATVRVSRLLAAVALPAYRGGRGDVVERWLAEFEQTAPLAPFADVAVAGAYVHALRGRGAEVARWLDAAARGERKGRAGRVAGRRRAVLAAALCREGPERMLADADAALTSMSRDDPWLPFVLLVRGMAFALAGNAKRGDSILACAAEAGAAEGAPEARALALAERALLADQDDRHP